jgi:hypothetical protein
MVSAVADREWPSPEIQERVTRDLLALLDTVPHRGDDRAYRVEAWEIAIAFMAPLLEEARAIAALKRWKPLTPSIH